MCVPNGMIRGPQRGQEGESKFGFTIGQRVEVTQGRHFQGWRGHVRAFASTSVAVELDEPPAGQLGNGQFFRPDNCVRHR